MIDKNKKYYALVDNKKNDIIPKEFNEEEARLYFCEIKDIFRFIRYGETVLEITLDEDSLVTGNSFEYSTNKAQRAVIVNKINAKTIEYLMKLGADIDVEGLLDWTMENRGLHLTKFLIEKGSNVDRLDKESALIQFAGTDYISKVEYLIKLGADIHHLEDQALITAACSKQFKITEFLLCNGAYLGTKNGFLLRIFNVNKSKYPEFIELFDKFL